MVFRIEQRVVGVREHLGPTWVARAQPVRDGAVHGSDSPAVGTRPFTEIDILDI
jgi:hypothetical protein